MSVTTQPDSSPRPFVASASSSSSAGEPDAPAAGAPSPKRAAWIGWVAWGVAGALLFAHAAIAWYTRIPAVATGNDDAAYLLLARSLRHFGYHDTYYVGSPVHSQYPPLYPALLAIVGLFTGDSPRGFLAMNVLLSTAALALVFDAVRRRSSMGLALMALALLAVNPMLTLYAGRFLSEPTATFFVALTVWALSHEPARRRHLILAGGAAIALALTRSVGVTTVIALGLLWLSERRFRAFAVFTVASIFTVGLWLGWTVVAPQRGTAMRRSYVHDAVAVARDPVTGSSGRRSLPTVLAKRALHNGADYLITSVPAQLPLPHVEGTTADNWLWLITIVVLSLVGATALWGGWRVITIDLVCYAAILALWSWPVGRFVVPKLPLIVVLLLVGARRLGALIGPRAAWIAPGALAAVIAGTAMDRQLDAARRVADCDRTRPSSLGCVTQVQQDFIYAMRFVGANAPQNAILVTPKEATAGFYLGRRSVPFPSVVKADSARLLDYLRDSGVSWVILAKITFGEGRLAQRMATVCDRLDVARVVSSDVMIFRLHPDSVVTDGAACRAIQQYLVGPRDIDRRTPASYDYLK